MNNDEQKRRYLDNLLELQAIMSALDDSDKSRGQGEPSDGKRTPESEEREGNPG